MHQATQPWQYCSAQLHTLRGQAPVVSGWPLFSPNSVTTTAWVLYTLEGTAADQQLRAQP
jgi:hypothetical protein